MKKLVLHGLGLNGKSLEPRLEFQVGATAHPYLRPLELSLLRLKKKILAGADFLFTQAVFDFEGFLEWMQRRADCRFRQTNRDHRKCSAACEVEKARELQKAQTYGPVPESVIARMDRSAQPAREGAEIAVEMALRLKEVPEIRGIHVLNGGSDSLIGEVIRTMTIA